MTLIPAFASSGNDLDFHQERLGTARRVCRVSPVTMVRQGPMDGPRPDRATTVSSAQTSPTSTTMGIHAADAYSPSDY